MCRYLCCGCNLRYTHKVLGFEEVNTSEEASRCSYIRIEVENPTASDGEFFCIKFRSIPVGLSSYPVRITINGCDVDVVNHSDRTITTADLYECILLSGMYTDNKLITC